MTTSGKLKMTNSWHCRLFAGLELPFGPITGKGIITFSDQAVVSATNFLTGVIIGRACSKEEFGIYLITLTVVLLFINIQDSVISIPYTVYMPRFKERKLFQYNGSTLVHQLCLSSLVTTFIILVGLILYYFIGTEGLGSVICALVVVITLILSREYVRQICFAGLQMKTAFLMDLCLSVVQISGLLVLAYLDLLSVSIAYLVIGVACGLVALTWFARFRNKFIITRTRVIEDLALNWSFGKWQLSAMLCFFAGSKAFPLFLAAFHGPEATGVLAACLGLSAIVNPLLIGMSNFLRPITSHALNSGKLNQLLQIIFKATVVIALFVGLTVAAAFIIGERLVTLIYGTKYADTGLTVAILMIGVFVDALVIPINCALFAMDRPDVGFKARLISLAVGLTIGLWLVKSFGILGVAMGLLAVNIVASLFEAITFTVVIRSNYQSIKILAKNIK